MVSRFKTISRLGIALRRRRQGGRIKIARRDSEAEARACTVPAAFGEKAAMRILDPEAPFPDLKTMFHNKDDFSAW
ncbi:MAG: Flp pilus assembly complex ATPase component TadA, partial [Deltaproteobacteria bacterium]|nr:Flp pilus assembly complex ATPase component TadA [Deltaproteobacteria bacterium]